MRPYLFGFCCLLAILGSVAKSQTPTPRNNEVMGNNAFPNISNIRWIDGAKYACTAAGIQNAVTDAGTGGTVHAEGCSKPFTWSSTVTISAPLTLYTPCTTMTFAVQIFNVTSDDIHIRGCGSGTMGQINEGSSPTSGTQFIASAVPATAIYVQKTGERSSLATARISGFQLTDLYLSMANTVNRAIHTVSCWDCRIENVIVDHLNCTDGGVYIQADLSGTTVQAETYFMRMRSVQALLDNSTTAQANTTCHPFYFDATQGEIAYGVFENLYAHGSAATSGGGSDGIFIDTGSTSRHQSFDQNVFINPKTSDPTTNAGGIKFRAKGHFLSPAPTDGRVFSVTLIDPQPERIFSAPGTGTGIGCVSASNVPDGTGCGFIHVIGSTPGGWANNEDYANLGTAYMSESTQRAVAQGPVEIKSGIIQGNNSLFTFWGPTLTASDNNQTLFLNRYIPNVNLGGFTGTTVVGHDFDFGDGTFRGNKAEVVRVASCNGYISWANTPWCFYQAGNAGNHFESFLEMGTSSQGNPGGITNGARIWYDQSNQRLRVSQNSGNQHRILYGEQGSCSMSSSAICTFSVDASFSSEPLCFVTSTTSPAPAISASCSVSGTTVTVSAGAPNSLTWNAILLGNPN